MAAKKSISATPSPQAAAARKPRVVVKKTAYEEPLRQEMVSETTPQKEKVLKPRNFLPLLVTALLMETFLLGMAFMKIQFLEKNQTAAQANTGNANNQAQNNQPSGPAAVVHVDNGHLPLQGKNDAKVTIVEFADLRCPFCHQLFTDSISQIRKDYIDTGKVKLAFRHYAFLGPASVTAANAAECANAQGKFWELHDYLYTNQPDESDTSMYTTDKLTSIAVDLGMNGDQFRTCLDGKKFDKNVSDDLAAGQKAGVSGTPTLFINGQSVVGAQPYNAIKTIIDQELAKK